MKPDVYQIVTDRIISELEAGQIPWEKPWVNTSGTNVARSHNDGRVYSLLNQMILGIPGEYVTFEQAKKQGGHVKKGSKSRPVVFWRMFYKDRKDKQGNVIMGEDGKPMKESIPVLKYFSVFHLEDTEGIEPKYVFSKGMVADNHPIEDAQAAVDDYLSRSGVTLRHYEQNESYYSPAEDKIILAHMNQFHNPESYYATLFHELGHSTGTESRLHRDMSGSFGDDKYSREELVAEITSVVLCNHFGIDTAKIQRNTAAYVQHWLKILKDDKRLIVTAAARAEKAVNLILNAQPEPIQEAC